MSIEAIRFEEPAVMANFYHDIINSRNIDDSNFKTVLGIDTKLATTYKDIELGKARAENVLKGLGNGVVGLAIDGEPVGALSVWIDDKSRLLPWRIIRTMASNIPLKDAEATAFVDVFNHKLPAGANCAFWAVRGAIDTGGDASELLGATLDAAEHLAQDIGYEYVQFGVINDANTDSKLVSPELCVSERDLSRLGWERVRSAAMTADRTAFRPNAVHRKYL